jgi:GH15 family glucan-1,4-alpha-glucosidase
VWPRDASFVAVAYARTGHLPDALDALDFLQRVQGADGSFHARYLPDGSGPPDGRGVQEDGPGWALWALSSVTSDPEVLARYRPLLDRSADRLVARAGLPPASSDYWEVREDRLTLGIAATTLAGLDAAAHVYDLLGDTARASVARAAADRTARAVEEAFGPRYPRHLGGRDVDAAVTFLLPPFQRRTVAGAREAALRAVPRLRRPAGGLAPGEGWKDDGVSWTPETGLFALTAAATGDRAAADHWLHWLDRHRTASGAIPEKVLNDGSPAAVAPLAWSAALALLTLTE